MEADPWVVVLHSCGKKVRFRLRALSHKPRCPNCNDGISVRPELSALLLELHGDRKLADLTDWRNGGNLSAWKDALSAEEIGIAVTSIRYWRAVARRAEEERIVSREEAEARRFRAKQKPESPEQERPGHGEEARERHGGDAPAAVSRRNSPVPSDAFGLLPARFELKALVGEGAFGRVLLAFDHTLTREVAIKELRPDVADDTSVVERFKNDARAVARLGHPNIVSVFDFMEPRHIIMEYLEMGSVRDRLEKDGKCIIGEAIRAGIDVLAGLQAAHEQGIVHRDVKPENVLFGRSTTAKLCDFGVAHLPDASLKTIRSTGMIHHPGTLAYMSPEQIRGEPLDGRSDLYSVGALLFEMASGESYIPVQDLRNVLLTAEAVQRRDPPRLGRLFGPIPRGFDEFLSKAMRKNREHRFRSAAEAATALKKLL